MGDIMEIRHTASEWKQMVLPALDSKAEELGMLGYSQATREEVWKCLVQKVWKGDPDKRIHEIIQDIFHLPSSTYLSYLTQNAYQDEGLMASIAALTGKNQD